MTHNNYTAIGIIMQAHGLKGYVIAQLEVALSSLNVDYLFIQIGHTLVPYELEQSTLQGQRASIKFKYIDSRSATHELIGASIWVSEKIIKPTLQKDNAVNLEGYQVIDVEKGVLGSVKCVEQFPLHACLVVDYLHKELLIPYEPALLQEINHNQKKINTKLPIGFLEAMGYK